MAGDRNAPPPLSSRQKSRATHFQDIEGGSRQGRETCGTCCNMCCAWASIAIWSLIILGLLAGLIFFLFIQSNLPQVRVIKLNVNSINVTDPSSDPNKETRLFLDLEITLNVTNKNEEIELAYGPLDAETTVGDAFILDRVRVPGFTQSPRSMKDLKVRTGLGNVAVNEADAKELKWSADTGAVVFTMKMTGKIAFSYKQHILSRLHLNIICQDIKQSSIGIGIDPPDASKCSVKLSPFR